MKTLFKFAFVAAIVAVVGYNVYKSQSVMNGMSEFALANVEALASDDEYDYIVARCITVCSELTGVCTAKIVNGVVGVKCDYTASGQKDCCGVASDQGSVGV